MTRKINDINNPNWKGDKVGYISLHDWIRIHKPKGFVCEICKKEPPYEVSNISGKYKRDIGDYKWVCRRCHMKEDGRLEVFKKNASKGGNTKKPNWWSNEQITFLVENYMKKSYIDIEKIIGKSEKAIQIKLSRMGLNKYNVSKKKQKNTKINRCDIQ